MKSLYSQQMSRSRPPFSNVSNITKQSTKIKFQCGGTNFIVNERYE